MRKLIVCLMLFGFAASVSGDALDDAVAHWGVADGTDLNGPPNSDLAGTGGTDISGETITAPNANTWVHSATCIRNVSPVGKCVKKDLDKAGSICLVYTEGFGLQ